MRAVKQRSSSVINTGRARAGEGGGGFRNFGIAYRKYLEVLTGRVAYQGDLRGWIVVIFSSSC